MPPVRTVLGMLALTVIYLVAAQLFDQDPETQPLENPYPLIRYVERDASLSSSYFGERAKARGLPFAAHYEFADGDSAPIHSPPGNRVQFQWSPRSLLADREGSLQIDVDPAAPGFRCRIPFQRDVEALAFVVSGRLKLDDADRALPALGIRAELESNPARSNSLQVRALHRDNLFVPSECDLWEPSVPPGQWLDFEIGLPVAKRPNAVALTIVTDQSRVLLDRILVRAATRIEGLLANGHPRAVGATEATRDLKRMLARGHDERLCLLLPPDTTLTYELNLPDEPTWLRLGITELSAAGDFGQSDFSIAISQEGEFEKRLFQETVGANFGDRFEDVRLDLSAYAGKRVRLQFRSISSEPSTAPVIALANPILAQTPKLKPKPPHILLLTYDRSVPSWTKDLNLRSTVIANTIAPSGSPDQSMLAAMTSLPPLLPRAAGRPQIPKFHPPLASALRQRGYRCLAKAPRMRTSHLLQGFFERTTQSGAALAADVADFLGNARPCSGFVLINLPLGNERAFVDELLAALGGGGHLQSCCIVIMPEPTAETIEIGKTLVLHPDLSSSVWTDTPWSLLDLAPTVLEIAGLPECDRYWGRGWSLTQLCAGEADGLPCTTFAPEHLLIHADGYSIQLEKPLRPVTGTEELLRRAQRLPGPDDGVVWTDQDHNLLQCALDAGIDQPTPLFWLGADLPPYFAAVAGQRGSRPWIEEPR